MKTKVIAFCGLKGHGKDTLATMSRDMLVSKNCKRIAFADPIKRMAEHVFRWDGRKDKKGRRFLQLLGTEVARCYYDGIWVDKAVANIKKVKQRYVFVTDLRFPNELEALRENFDVTVVKVVKVEGKLTRLMRYIKTKLGLVHASELCFKDEECDVIISNDFTDPKVACFELQKLYESWGVVVVDDEGLDAEEKEIEAEIEDALH